MRAHVRGWCWRNPVCCVHGARIPGLLRSCAGCRTGRYEDGARAYWGRQGCIRREGASEAAPEAVRQAVGGGCQSGWGGYCRLSMPWKPALAARETVAGHRLGALEGGGDPPPFLVLMPDCGVHYLWFAFVCFLIRSHPPFLVHTWGTRMVRVQKWDAALAYRVGTRLYVCMPGWCADATPASRGVPSSDDPSPHIPTVYHRNDPDTLAHHRSPPDYASTKPVHGPGTHAHHRRTTQTGVCARAHTGIVRRPGVAHGW